MRVNARLDDSYAEKFEQLQAVTQLSVSDIIRESVDRYYAAIVAETRRRQAGLDGLVGAFAGRPDTPADLSQDYKQLLAEAIDARIAERQAR